MWDLELVSGSAGEFNLSENILEMRETRAFRGQQEGEILVYTVCELRYILSKGLVALNSRVGQNGVVWGEDFVLSDTSGWFLQDQGSKRLRWIFSRRQTCLKIGPEAKNGQFLEEDLLQNMRRAASMPLFGRASRYGRSFTNLN